MIKVHNNIQSLTSLGFSVMKLQKDAKDMRAAADEKGVSQDKRIAFLEQAYDMMSEFSEECMLAHYHVLHGRLKLRGGNSGPQSKTEERIAFLSGVVEAGDQSKRLNKDSLAREVLDHNPDALQKAVELWPNTDDEKRIDNQIVTFIHNHRKRIF